MFVEVGKNVELRISVSEAELLGLVRRATGRAGSASRSHLKGLAKTDLVAKFSTARDTIVLSGTLRRRLPIDLVLKPGTATYRNFVAFVVTELRKVGASPAVTLRSPSENSTSENSSRQVVSDLASHLEEKLKEAYELAQLSAQEISGIVDIFGNDFEVVRPTPQRRARRDSLRHAMPVPQQFRIVDPSQADAQLISGFLSLEIQQVDVVREVDASLVSSQIHEQLIFHSGPEVDWSGEVGLAKVHFSLSPELMKSAEMFFRWGNYLEGEEHWVDDEVSPEELEQDLDGTWCAKKKLRPERSGRYGVTFFVRALSSREAFWAGAYGYADAVFEVPVDFLKHEETLQREKLVRGASDQAQILKSLGTFKQFARAIEQLAKGGFRRSLAKSIYEVTRSNSELRRLVSEYYDRAVTELSHSEPELSRTSLNRLCSVLQNLGLGEVVFIAPEGPQAIAGGVAQVMVGLSESLVRNGVSVTLISNLYEESQGNKHKSAEELLQTGVVIAGETVPLREIGEVRIPFGPTLKSGTSQVANSGFVSNARVYEAVSQGVRLLLLRHRRHASRLYAGGQGDALLRQAVFLSRGSLEIMRAKRFHVNPHLVITNDWMTGLVPVILKTDPRYSKDEGLSRVETIHILHNCGRAYQGRFFANQDGEDLWPMLKLLPEHFFGLTDPLDLRFLNLTAGAVYHTTRALLTVSRPYAAQLLTPEGGEGLHPLFQMKRNILFGISNGVDLEALRRIFWRVRDEKPRRRPSTILSNVNNAAEDQDRRILRRLLTYKRSAKYEVQQRYGLEKNPEAILLSFVGRLAEQKGIQLFAERLQTESMTVLESLLRRHPRIQLLIGGPANQGDSVVEQLRNLVEFLHEKYPGRIHGVFDFILHKDALEIAGASDLFLMPSRYEPGGITQLEALAAGTLVVARNVGGISATLQNYTEAQSQGNAFLFEDYTGLAFREAVSRGVKAIEDEKRRRRLILQAAFAEHDWDHRVPKYVALLQHAAGALCTGETFPHLDIKRELLETSKP